MIYRLQNPETLEEAVASQAADLVRDGFTPKTWLSDPNHIALTDGRNIGMFEAQEEAGVFFGHTIFQDRGRTAIEAAKSIIKFLVDFFGARIIRGETPIGKRNARWFSRQVGFHSLGIKATPHGDVEQFVMECV